MGYSEYLADSLFCNDRSIPGKEKSGLETDTGLGYGTNGTAYGGRARFYDGLEYKKDFKPIFTCPQKNDAFTVNDTSYGNGALKYPIALITADEVIAAGAILPNSNSNYYLGNINYMWTLTPANYFINRNADVITDTFDGLHDDIGVIWNGKTSPVINLSYKSALKLQGSGTIENPYTLISDLV